MENQIKLICYQFANEKTSGVFMCNYHVCFQLGANGQTNSGQKHISVVRGGDMFYFLECYECEMLELYEFIKLCLT